MARGGVLEKGQVGLLEGDGAEAVVPLEKNTEWIQRVAKEFMSQVRATAGSFALSDTAGGNAPAPGTPQDVTGRLDQILSAIERGQILLLDGDTLVGGTVDRMDAALGQRRAFVVRGAV